jgi:hypothetical protein
MVGARLMSLASGLPCLVKWGKVILKTWIKIMRFLMIFMLWIVFSTIVIVLTTFFYIGPRVKVARAELELENIKFEQYCAKKQKVMVNLKSAGKACFEPSDLASHVELEP